MPKTILMMDNDVRFLDVHARLLESEGYRVLRAATIAEAEAHLQTQNIHLAILDIRMADDTDSNDISGLRLAEKSLYSALPKIILTAYAAEYDFEVLRAILGLPEDGLPKAVNFLDKERDGSEELIKVVNLAFARYVTINWHLALCFALPLSALQIALMADPTAPEESWPSRRGEVEDLLRKLFVESAQLTISNARILQPGITTVDVAAYDLEGIETLYTIICGNPTLVNEEYRRFQRLQYQVNSLGLTAKGEPEEGLALAAMAYRYQEIDADRLQTLRAFYHTRPIDDVRVYIHSFFCQTLPAWHSSGRESYQDADAARYLASFFGINGSDDAAADLMKRTEALLVELQLSRIADIELTANTIRIPTLNSAYNAIYAAYPNPFSNIFNTQIIANFPLLVGMTHGNLHADTILFGPNGETRLLAFGRAARAPIVCDFIAVEMTIKLELLETIDFQARYRLEELLLESFVNESLNFQTDALGQELSAANLQTGSEAKETEEDNGVSSAVCKAYTAIQQVRLCFLADNSEERIVAYWHGLLYAAIGYLQRYQPNVRHQRPLLVKYAHCLMLAALLCQKLSTEEHADVPRQARHSIWVNPANQSVWVQGRAVKLTPEEYKILKYLYEHPNRLCKRHEIISADSGVEVEQDNSRLNTTMYRLRKKIEPDPNNPKFIESVRGEGYILHF